MYCRSLYFVMAINMALMKGAKIALEIDTDQSIADNTTSQDNCTAERSPPRRGRRFYAALGAICLVNIVVALDASVVSVALPVTFFLFLELPTCRITSR
jgi:hypothetical protein